MDRRTMLMALLLAALALPAWTQEKPAPEVAARAEVRGVVVRWLECEECTDGELQAVVRLGERALPTLAATLEGGPSPASLEAHRAHLQDTYRALKAYEKQHPGAKVQMSEEEYVKTYLDNYVALYKSRSAIALGRIGGPQARNALQKALQAPLREDVRDSVRRSLEKMGRPQE